MMTDPHNPEPEVKAATPKEIVSVNSRGGSSENLAGKVAFVVALVLILVMAGLFGFNKWRAAKKADAATIEKTSSEENKPAAVGARHHFDTDPPPLPGTQPSSPPRSDPAAPLPSPTGGQACTDGQPGTAIIGPDSKPIMSPAGVPMRVCKDGRLVVPALKTSGNEQPIPLASNNNQPGRQQSSGTPPVSRYAGDVVVSTSNSAGGVGLPPMPPMPPLPADPAQAMAMMQSLMNGGKTPVASSTSSGALAGSGTSSAPGSIGSLLTPSSTPMVTASMIGDRNMLLPKGRTIDCGLSMRLVNEVSGMATCVLSSNVYSDNGRTLLLERGSEASGEYMAAMQQGQRRLFVLWSRIKTPNGVVISLNSPGADGLGTSGMDGIIDNHWWDRIGAAFLLSMVQDVITYETTPKQGTQSVAVFQQTSQTGNRMAEKVLESTINIKPTLFKNQGDRGTIFVARDLDFSTVYALRAR